MQFALSDEIWRPVWLWRRTKDGCAVVGHTLTHFLSYHLYVSLIFILINPSLLLLFFFFLNLLSPDGLQQTKDWPWTWSTLYSNTIHAADVGERNQNHQNTTTDPAGLADTKSPSDGGGSRFFFFLISNSSAGLGKTKVHNAAVRVKPILTCFFLRFYFPFSSSFELTQWLPSSRAFKRQGVSTETWFYTLVRILISARRRRTPGH